MDEEIVDYIFAKDVKHFTFHFSTSIFASESNRDIFLKMMKNMSAEKIARYVTPRTISFDFHYKFIYLIGAIINFSEDLSKVQAFVRNFREWCKVHYFVVEKSSCNILKIVGGHFDMKLCGYCIDKKIHLFELEKISGDTFRVLNL